MDFFKKNIFKQLVYTYIFFLYKSMIFKKKKKEYDQFKNSDGVDLTNIPSTESCNWQRLNKCNYQIHVETVTCRTGISGLSHLAFMVLFVLLVH